MCSGVKRIGQRYNLRFKVIDSESNRPKLNLEDVAVLVFLAPGIWQQREWAKPVGDGVYEMSFVPPEAGVYYIFFQCPWPGLQFKPYYTADSPGSENMKTSPRQSASQTIALQRAREESQ